MLNKISWTQIGNSLWIVCSVLVALICFVLIWDFLDTHSFASQNQSQNRLKFLKHESKFENTRLLFAQMTHPSRFFGKLIEAFAVVLGIIQYIIYIYSTYLEAINIAVTIVTIICTSYFFSRILIRILLFEPGQRINLILTMDVMVDISCSVSSIFPFTNYIGTSFTFLFLRPINVYFSYCCIDGAVNNPKTTRFQCSRVQRLLIRISLIIFSFLGLFAGTIATVETAGNLNGWNIIVTSTFSSFNSLYFAIETLATVGFGDIVPTTFFGRFFTSFFIISGICLSATIVNSLLSVLALQKSLVGTEECFVNKSLRPIILFLGEPSARQVEELLCELFPANTFGGRLNFHVVVLLEGANFHPSMASYLHHHHLFGGRVTYLSGSVGDMMSLQRAGAMSKECHAAFVLQRRLALSDSLNLLRMLALRRFCPQLPLFMTLSDSTNRQIAIDSGVPPHNLFLTDTIRHGLLAASAVAPGASTLLINLWSTPVIDTLHLNSDWMKEYSEGMLQQLVEVKVPRWLVGRTIKDCCVLIYLAPILCESHDELQFINVEALVSSMSLRLHSATAEGAVVLAVKQRRRDQASFIHCNLESLQRLRRSDSLFIVTNDSSTIGTDVVKIGTNILPMAADENGEERIDESQTQTQTLSTSPTPDESSFINSPRMTERSLFIYPPPLHLSGHVIVITHQWLDSLALFFIPFRLSSLRPVVVLSPSAPPTAEWISKLSLELSNRGGGNLSGLYFVQGLIRNPHEKSLCVLDKAHSVIIITTGAPKERSLVQSDTTGLFHDLFSREEVMKGIESAEIEVDTEAVLATVHLERYKHESLSIITEVASSKSHLLLGSDDAFVHSSTLPRTSRPLLRHRATLSTSDARRLAFRTGRSMRSNNTLHHHQRDQSSVQSIDDAGSSSESDPDETVRRIESSPPVPPMLITEGVTLSPIPPHEEEKPHELSPIRLSARFAAGRLFPSQTLNTLLVQALFNPSLLRLITLFASNQDIRILSIPLNQKLLSIPSGERNFGIVYLNQLLDHNQLTLGLYRRLKSSLPYVYTNPKMSTIVLDSDLLFVCVPQRE